MVGNSVDAALALAGTEPVFSDEGSTRIVYLINGVIYKVNRSIHFNENAQEYAFGNDLRANPALPKNVRIPNMTLWRDVLACEYVDGISTGDCLDLLMGLQCSHEAFECMDPILVDRLTYCGWSDPTWGNAIYSKGYVYLVDVAY